MDPITMMVASIGMQFFNNYANNEKNDEIQAQQREFQIAAAEHDFERMRKAQAAAAKLALELEAEVHKERVEDIEKGYDTLLDNFANSFAITDWPLNVLPFIMKGESFGTLFGGTAKSISMHCILTPSNCAWFNEYFYDDLDFRVEAEMNNTWNAQSTHHVVYYGGGWNRRQNNLNGGSTPALIDLDDIALLKNKLKQIPTMVITPYFDPYLHFRVQLWGMGKDTNTPFRIDVPHGDIESSSRIFSYDYNKNIQQELTDDFFNVTMDEFVPYLEKLIGFVADKYFWSVYGLTPVFPVIAKTKRLLFYNDNDKKCDYLDLIDCVDENTIISHGVNRLLGLINVTIDTHNEDNTLALIRKVLCQVCNSRSGIKHCNQNNLEEHLVCGYFGFDDLFFINGIMSILENFQSNDSKSIYKKLFTLSQDIINLNENAITQCYSYITLHDFLDHILKSVVCKHGEEDTLVLDLIHEKRLVTAYYLGDEFEDAGIKHYLKYNFQIDGFLVPLELKMKSPKRLKIKRKNIESFMEKIAFDCDANLFYTVINLEKIVEYCRDVIDNIKSCSLYIKDSIPTEVRKSLDDNLTNHLVYCEIISKNNEVVHHLFYYDRMEGELEESFLLTNNLIIQ